MHRTGRLILSLLLLAARLPAEARLHAGAAVCDITPTGFPVRVNGMFTERTADKAVDALEVCALALADGTNRVVIAVVDTCMVPRDLIDEAKRLASAALASAPCAVPADRMLVSATHTHSAPAAMGCLGSRADPVYAAMLPARIASAITNAVYRLAPAEAGWGAVDDWDHTFNRRWIRRPDRLLKDPFGAASVRANMHPGYNSPDVTGPSGPVDPGFTVLSIRHADGRPLAVLANYSMHYIGSPLLSADYFGRFRHHLAAELKAGPDFVALMTQGTSGDLASMDYGSPGYHGLNHDAYARVMVTNAVNALRGATHHPAPALAMAETRLTLNFRAPPDDRLRWAREVRAKLGDSPPKSQPEIYALEALHLEARPRAELVLQALRVGDLGITALPNEVYALTGLKLKARSPLPLTLNVGLANGAEGYIPPPEQHALGGYTTWPARTAGLEEQAEPRIVESVLALLETVAGAPRREMTPPPGPAVQASLALKPDAYWRLDEPESGPLADATGHGHDAVMEPGVALYLPGAGTGLGYADGRRLTGSAFTAEGSFNRAVHTAGGRLRPRGLAAEGDYSVSLWFWSGIAPETRAVAGYLASFGADGDKTRGEHWGLGGSFRAECTGRLIAFNGDARDEVVTGRTVIPPRTWNHAVFTRKGDRVMAWLNGTLELDAPLARTTRADDELFLGGRADRMFGWEGRLDEAAYWKRALTDGEALTLFTSAGLPPAVAPAAADEGDPPPLSPEEAKRAWVVRDGFRVELAACEPQVVDPVAFDWDSRGRLWVVEMRDYPLGLDGRNQPGGRVRRLEDRDGDDFFETSTVFADGLGFPTGILAWRDGVLVTAAPDIVYLPDRDDNGEADERRVLFTGFSQGNQQLRVNGLRWGLDNWVYCASGGHHGGHAKDTRVTSALTGKQVFLGPKDCRLRPDTGEIEPVEGPTQFGRNRDARGNWFGSQNSWPLWHYTLPDAALARNPHVAMPAGIERLLAPANPPVYPASAAERRYHSHAHASHYTSACSGMVYDDDLLFPPGPEQHAFACEPFHNLVQHAVLTRQGSTFAAAVDTPAGGTDFLASRDRWCRPVMVRAGPDGALWVADMVRLVIEHPDWLPEPARSQLMPRYRRGDDRGRIWRVVRADQPARSMRRPERLEALASPSGWVRDRAHMEALWLTGAEAETFDQRVRTELDRLESGPTSAGARRGWIPMLSILRARGTLEPGRLARALAAAEPGVVEHALRLAAGSPDPAVIAAAARQAGAPDGGVRLALALEAGVWPDPAIGSALVRIARAEDNDVHLRAAVTTALPAHLPAFAAAVASATEPALLDYAEPVLLTALGTGAAPEVDRLLATLLSNAATGSVERLAVCGRVLDALASRPLTGELAARVRERTDGLFTGLAAALERSPASPGAVAALLLRSRAHRVSAIRALAGELEPDRAPERRAAALRALASHSDSGADTVLLAAWPRLSAEDRGAAADALLSRPAWTRALLAAVGDGRVERPVLDASRRLRLAHSGDAGVREQASRLFAEADARAAVVARYQGALVLRGDAARGQQLFSTHCAACHALDGKGGLLGPDLRSVASQPAGRVLTSILDPNATIEPGFAAYQATLRGGEELFGLLAAEAGETLHFRVTGGADRVVRRADVEKLAPTGRSLMPEGLEQVLDAQAVADLLARLRPANP